MTKYQHREDVPEEFLDMIDEIARNKPVSKANFVKLCMKVVDLVDSGQVSSSGRSHMAYRIAGIWLANKNIDEDDLLNEIGGEFGTLEMEGYFDLNDELSLRSWEQLKGWINKANVKYGDESVDDIDAN